MKNTFKNTSILVFLFIFGFTSALTAQEIMLSGHVYSGNTSSGELIPIAGAQVGIGMNSVPEGTLTHSDENGYYELHFEWNWDGPIPIACEAEGYEFFLATIFPEGNSIEVEFDIVLTPTSGGGDMTHLEGNVWQNNGCLGGPVGCPIEGATISAVPLNSPNDVAFSAVSDNWGHYIIDLPIGAYMITCSAEGWLSDSVDMTISAEGAVYDFHLFEDGINTEVYFSGTVSGEVSPQLPAFVPIEGAVVYLFGGFTGGILAETHSNENGYFEFGDVVMSATAVSIEAAGYQGQDHSIMELCDSSNPNSMDCFPFQHDFYLNMDYQQEVATLFGMVSGQMSQMGPEFPIAGATITVTPGNVWEPFFTTTTDENGNYELQIENPDPTVAWLVTCTAEEFGTQTTEVYLVYQLEIEVNFHFTAWEEPEVPAPFDLTVELVETESWYPIALLDWQYPPVDDFNMPSVFNVYGQVDSNNDGWVHAATTYDTQFEMALGGVVGYNGCFYVTAVQGGVESEPSNIACGENDPPDIAPPYDLSIEILESEPLQAALNWHYDYDATDPANNMPVYLIYANWSWNEDDEWQLVGETNETHHQFVIGDVIDMSTCFRVTAIVEGVESEASNVACIESDPSVPAPYDLTVEYEPNPLGGTAHLNWHYDNYWGIVSTFNIYVNYGWADNEWMLTGTSQTHNFDYLLGDFWWPEQLCFKVTAIDPFSNVESESSNVACADLYPDPECEDLSGLHFGDCEMVIGIGWNGEECTYYSGCGTVDQFGVDHSNAFFDSLEECNDACTDVAEHGTLAGEVFYQWGDAIEIVSGALIQVHNSAGNNTYTTETNENGFYLLENIPVGNYAVSCTVHTGETMTQEVEIIAGTSAIVDFWFGEPDYPNILTGMVYGSDEELSVILDGHIIAHTMDGDLFETWIEGGSYWLDLPWASEYYIVVEAEGYFSADATVMVNGITEMDFYLTPIDDGMMPDAILSLGDGIGISNGDITIPLFLSSDVPISSLEFAVYPVLENWDEWYYLEPSGLESTYECFSSEWGNVYGQLWGIMAGIDGCVFESHEMQHIANLTFTSHDEVPTGYEIPMIFNYLLVLDADGNEVFTEGEGSTITFGLMGDINFDGTINVLDVVALVNFVIYIDEPNNAEFSAGDLNHDGELDVLDVVLMVNAILSGYPLSEDCYIIPEVGPCDGICPTYYFNQDSGECEEFITGCCGVEAFHSMEACIETCIGW
ncbi:MAG: carboxypeptidase regulatory-like domain-containing protein [Candidatus Marinimicrobia bacterium]|nr:carboxypeptidase regulatory-like domain-containing protein [Candidatus Neomarinimicrobiota bacterium]